MTKAKQYALAQDMRHYILDAMRQVFGDKCQECGEKKRTYQIDHKRYADDVTIYDLQLLCSHCHNDKTSQAHEAYLSGEPHCETCCCF